MFPKNFDSSLSTAHRFANDINSDDNNNDGNVDILPDTEEM